MQDLSKIDWTKCKLPKWQSRDCCASIEEWGMLRVFCNRVSVAVRSTVDDGYAWEVAVSELRRMAKEALPPWRECALEEAMENPGVSECKISEPPLHSGWFPARWINWLDVDVVELKKKAIFHTRAPKAEAKMPTVKAPEGWRWERRTDSGVVLADQDDREVAVPMDPSKRDAMLACVAAYDHAHDADGYLYDRGHRWLLVEVSS